MPRAAFGYIGFVLLVIGAGACGRTSAFDWELGEGGAAGGGSGGIGGAGGVGGRGGIGGVGGSAGVGGGGVGGFAGGGGVGGFAGVGGGGGFAGVGGSGGFAGVGGVGGFAGVGGSGGFVGMGGSGGFVGMGGSGGFAGQGGLCGALVGRRCLPEQYCDIVTGACGQVDLGQCFAVPVPCPMGGAPVCGCDGKTYPSDCLRRNARVSKRHDGACSPGIEYVREGQACDDGGRRVCVDGLFCDRKEGLCSVPNASGICRATTRGCPAIYAPVCGCNGRTYANDCERIAARVPAAHAGACAGGLGAACGGRTGLSCAPSLWCEPPPGLCSRGDVAGSCQPIMDPRCGVVAPVCGCDGRTYVNDCDRRTAQTGKLREGACEPMQRYLESGTWGGERAVLTVRDPRLGGVLALDCGAVNVADSLVIQPDGAFKWSGIYTYRLPVVPPPLSPDAGAGAAPLPVITVPITLAGRAEGRVMTLTLYYQGREVGPFRLIQGEMGRLYPCSL